MGVLITFAILALGLAAWLLLGSRLDAKRTAAAARGEDYVPWHEQRRRGIRVAAAVAIGAGLVSTVIGLFGNDVTGAIPGWLALLMMISSVVFWVAAFVGAGWLMTWAARRRLRRLGEAGREPILLEGRRLRLAQGFWVTSFVATAVVSALFLVPLWQEASRTAFVQWAGGVGSEDFWSMNPGMAVALTGENAVPAWYPWLVVVRQGLASFAALALAWFIYSRRSRHWMALFVSLFIAVTPTIPMAEVNSRWESLALIGEPASVLAVAVVALAFLLITAFFYVFPDGRFRATFARFAAVVVAALVVVGVILRPGDEAEWPWLLALFLFVVGIGGAVAAQLYRYREASAGERRDARLIFVGLIALALWIVPGAELYRVLTRPGWGTFVWQQSFLVLHAATPLLVGFGILYLVRRQGWWDLKLFLNRGAVLSMLVPVMALAYVGIVLVLTAASDRLFGDQSRAVAILIATTTIAVSYRPLRTAFQSWVNRRWFPSRARADAALATFTEGIRDEVAGETVHDRLVDAVDGALSPGSIGVWLPGTGEAST